MRLLVRSNAHRQLEEGGAELASSPDTVGRERWRWDLRLDDNGQQRADVAQHEEVCLQRGEGTITLTFDPTHVEAHLEHLDPDGSTQLNRSMAQLLVIVAGEGGLVVEGRHLLNDMDVLVLEGDDPFTVSVETTPTPTPAPTAAAAPGVLARVSYVDGSPIAWVP